MQTFISYKREDQSFAERLRDMLRQWGYRAWLDTADIAPGENWDAAIHRGIRESQVVIGLLAPESVASENVLDEWIWAKANNRRLLLLWLRDISEEDIPPQVSRVQRIDVRKDLDGGFEMLRQTLASPGLITPTPVGAQYIASKPDIKTATDTNRARMLQKVHDYWIVGVLENALRDSEFELGMTLKTDAVLKHVDYGDYTLPTTSGIAQVFDNLGRELLILGAPGAGKTILMLQLAHDLLDLAQGDDAQPIPVVLNLSSWAEKRASLNDWLVERLNAEYQVSRKLGKRWVDDEKLLLLLDGLDEVKEEFRNECVAAINAFRQQYRTVPVVVCSRIADYELLTERLHLRGAVALQPLTEEQVAEHLKRPEFATLRDALTHEAHLREMATTPFLLNTMTFTYRGATAGEVGRFEDAIERRNHLFDRYVKRRFDQHPQDRYSLGQTKRWLGWLASKLVEHKESVFYIEKLQFDWLTFGWQKYLYTFTARVSHALVIGSVTGIFWGFGNFVTFSILTMLDYWRIGDFRIEFAIGNRFAWNWFSSALTIFIVCGLFSSIIATLLKNKYKGRDRIVSTLSGIAGILGSIRLDPTTLLNAYTQTNLLGLLMLTMCGAVIGWWLSTVEQIKVSEKIIWTLKGVVRGVFLGIIYALLIGIIAFLYTIGSLGPVGGVIVGFSFGFITALFPALTIGFASGLRGYAVENRSLPNEGILHLTDRVSVIMLLVAPIFGTLSVLIIFGGNLFASITSVIFYISAAITYFTLMFVFTKIRVKQTQILFFCILLFGWVSLRNLAAVLIFERQERVYYLDLSFIDPYFGFGLFFAFLIGALFGGLSIFKHFVLRQLLIKAHQMPWNYARFLDFAASRMLLRKVGGGYIFIHRMLLEYFAGLETGESGK